ncbi:MAG: peptide chain release factor 3, partial [Armatimonadetes bacterium]|nr:peptide chain release factor 3 [Armatimonadota bacterium]
SKRIASVEKIIDAEEFSGFVFKIQANMDPNHRDRISFMRIVTGKFERDMEVKNRRSGKSLKLSRPQRLFGQDRETVETAYPGDIIGLTNPGAFNLGDTLSNTRALKFDEVPEFVPEVFARLSITDVSRVKHFEKGIVQLAQEGLIQLFWDARGNRNEPVLGAIGKLQFEVVQYRLLSEYGVKTAVQVLSYEVIRWLQGSTEDINKVYWGENALRLADTSGNPVVLIATEWNVGFLVRQNEAIKFLASPSESFTALASGV